MISQRPAIACGGMLDEEPDALATLPEALARAARQDGTKGIIYLQPDGSELTQSYRDLCEEAERILAGLRALGLRAGDKVILQIEENHLYLSTFWACVLGGIVAVPISIAASYEQPGVVTARLQNAWELCERPIVVASARVASALCALVPALGMEGVRIETLDTLRSAFSAAERQEWHSCQPDDVFLLLFTSGSTGVPKGVMLTHRNVLTVVRGYTYLEGVKEREVSFNWMPLDHVGGLITFHVRDVCLGYQQIHTSSQTILQDPLSWLDWLDHYRATRTWAPNFAFGLINKHLANGTERRWDLSELHYILNAGEAIVAKTARKFLKLLAPYGLRSTAIHPSWGMSETASGATFSSRFALETTADEDRFVDVGALIPTVWIRIVDQQGHVLDEGQNGEVQVKGPTVTPGYYRNPEQNKEVFTADGWFATGDVGFLRGGRLTITGRTKNIIIINGLNYYCHEIEAVVEEVAGIEATYTGACAVRVASDNTDELAIFYCTQFTDEQAIVEQWHEIRALVVSAVGINPAHLLPVAREVIPKTETGKIQRSKLKQQFEAGTFQAIRTHIERLLANTGRATDSVRAERSEAQMEIERKLQRIWRRVLGIEEIDIHDNFFDLGGDSLVNMRIVALARSANLPMTQNHIADYPTIAELAATLAGAL